jgi:hypothetical protein
MLASAAPPSVLLLSPIEQASAQPVEAQPITQSSDLE